MLEDWYVNEENGDLMFDEDEHRDEIGSSDGSKLSRLGDNNFFGKEAVDGETYMYLGGETAENFACENGFKKVTSEVEITIDETAISVPMGKFGSATFQFGTEHTEGIGFTYVENDKVPIGSTDTKHSKFEIKGFSGSVDTYEVYQERIVYGEPEKSSFIDFYLKYNPSIVDAKIKTNKNVYE